MALLTGKCPVSPALEGLPLKAGSLPAGRQEGAQYRSKMPYREATPFRAWSFTFGGVLDCNLKSSDHKDSRTSRFVEVLKKRRNRYSVVKEQWQTQKWLCLFSLQSFS